MNGTLHDVYGASVHAEACNAIDGDHICMRGRSTVQRGNPGPHRCACKHRWQTDTNCGVA